MREIAVHDQCEGILQTYPHKRLQEAFHLVDENLGATGSETASLIEQCKCISALKLKIPPRPCPAPLGVCTGSAARITTGKMSFCLW